VFLVILYCVNIGKDSRVLHRELESVMKIAADYGSGPLRKVLFKEFREEITAEEYRMASPSLERGNHQGGTAFGEAPDQGSDRGRGKERVVYGRKENRRGAVR